MQKVVRSSLAALLSIAALSACGDKVTVAAPTTTPVVVPHITSVNVSGPTSYTLGTVTGDSLSYGSTVVADAGFTGSRATTWTSSNPAVFRITSGSGAGKALAAGSTVITATSAVDGVSGSVSLTVTGASTSAPASVVITAITQGANGPPGSVLGANVDLGNAGGEIDVVTSISFTPANRPAAVSLELDNPTTGALVATCDTRPFGGASDKAANADIAPVTLSCLTAAFNATTGVTTFKNGQYLLKASLSGAANSSTTPVITAITINNGDFLRASFTGVGTTAVAPAHPTAQVTPTSGGQAGRAWNSGSVNVTVLPVLYTPGRSVTSATVQLLNASNGAFGAPGGGQVDVGAFSAGGCVAPLGNCRSATNPAAADAIPCGGIVAQTTSPAVAGGAFSPTITFSGTDSTTLAGVENVMVDTMIVFAFATDQAGNAVTTLKSNNIGTLVPYGAPFCGGPFAGASTAAITSGNFIRLDNRDPAPSMFDPRATLQGANDEFVINGQNSAFLGSRITFPTAAVAGNGLALGADAGANSVAITYQYAPINTAKTGTWTTITCTTAPCTPATSNIPATSDPFQYWIRMITKDALGNADTTRIELGQSSVGGTVIAPPLVADNGTNPASCTAIPAATNCAATFGVDVVAPTGQVGTGVGIVNARISNLACLLRQQQVAGTSTTLFSCADPRLGSPINTSSNVSTANSFIIDPVQFSMSDALGSNGATGSQFGATPVIMAIRRLAPSATSTTASITTCIDPTQITTTAALGDTYGVPVAVSSTNPTGLSGELAPTTADPNCVAGKPVSANPLLPSQQGVYTVTWQVVDEANNASVSSSFTYVVDNTPPTVAINAISFPSTVSTGSLFTTTGGTFVDNLDVVGANGFVYYPNGGIMVGINATTSVVGNPFDGVLTRQVDATATLPTNNEFARTLWIRGGSPNVFATGGKPDRVGIRTWDGALNLSVPAIATLGASAIGGGANPFLVGGSHCLVAATNCDYTDFVLATPTTATCTPGVSGGSGSCINTNNNGTINNVDLTAAVTAPANSLQSPFSQVCFYYSQRGYVPAAGAVAENIEAPVWDPTTNLYTTNVWNQATGTFTVQGPAAAAPTAGIAGGGVSVTTFTTGFSDATATPPVSGDLMRIGCSAVSLTTGGGAAGVRTYTYFVNQVWSATLRAAGRKVRWYAIGIDANGDAVLSTAGTIILP